MNYYLYISEPKIDMLLPQIPESTKKKIATEIGFDLKLFKASLKEEINTLDNKISKSKVVEEYLLNQKDEIGNIDENKAWIVDETDVKFLDIGEEDAVLFVGKTSKSIFCLAGSSRNVVGHSGKSDYNGSFSFLPNIIRMFNKWTEEYPNTLTGLPEKSIKGSIVGGVSQGFNAWIDVMHYAIFRQEAKYQKVKFLAKRLTSEKFGEFDYIMLSPLFIYSIE